MCNKRVYDETDCEEQQKAADVNGDGKIDASDATKILQYYSYLSTGGDLDFKSFIK